MEKLGLTEKRRSDTFDATKEAIGRVYETICCSLVSQRCVCSSISRGTIRKLGGGKIKGNVETNLPSRLHRSTCLVYHFPRPRARRPYLFLVSSSLWISILVDGDDVTSTDEIFTPFWERNLSFFGFETRKMWKTRIFSTPLKNFAKNLSFGFFWIDKNYWRLIIFENWKFFDLFSVILIGGGKFCLIFGNRWRDIINGGIFFYSRIQSNFNLWNMIRAPILFRIVDDCCTLSHHLDSNIYL